jgi:hypothetical protein
MSWWDMVSPQGEQEMIPFLRTYMGKGKQFRTPKRMWEDLWRLKRGDMNHVMGMRNFKGPKYQKGIICAAQAFGGAVSTEPDLSDVAHDKATSSAATRIHIAYDSDGTIEHYFGTTALSILYTKLTTQDNQTANDHTLEWWPDSPETNEGLNWDIRYTNLTSAFTFFFTTTGTAPAARVEDTWYLLDTVSNDHVDATTAGSLAVRITAKGTGTTNGITDVEIRPTGGGSTVASHNVNIQVIGT